MVEISLLDKIKTVFNLIFSTPLFLVLLVGFLLMIVDIFVISKKSKTTKYVYLVISLAIIVLLLRNYIFSVSSLFDTIAKNIVTIIYFPSVLEYILMLLFSLIILFVGLLNKRTNNKIKIVNAFAFSINMFLFFLILDVINNGDIDLTNKISIYTNENLMVLFELSLGVFILWITILILHAIIRKLSTKEEVVEVKPNDFYEPIELPKTLEELRKMELMPDPKIEYVIVEKKRDEDMFTLEEYRQMRELLVAIKNKQIK